MTSPTGGNATTKTPNGWPIIAFAAMLWGSDVLLRPSILHLGVAPVTIVLLEHIALGVVFLPILIAKRSEWRTLRARDWVALLYLGWAGSAVGTVLLTMAYQLGSPVAAALLQKTQPLFAVVLAGIVLGERRRGVFWLLFVGCVAATYLISFGFTGVTGALRSPSAIAAFCALGAAGLWGSCTVVGRALSDKLSPPLVAGWRFVLALPLLVVLNERSLAPHSLSSAIAQPTAMSCLALIVLLPDVLGMTLYYVGLKRTPASLATLAELAYPLSALLLGIGFAHQRLAAGQWVGLVLLIACLQGIQATHSVRISRLPRLEPLQTNASPAPYQET